MSKRGKFLLVLTLLLATGVVGLLVLRAQALPGGPRPVVWDKEACAECGMSVSDRGFAAQLQLADGQVLNFDDPGCLFIYLADKHPAVHAVYFHAMNGEEWLSQEEAAFVTTDRSPMGYELGAVRRGTPGALTFEQAREKVERRAEQKGE
jgi:hypothetical protein